MLVQFEAVLLVELSLFRDSGSGGAQRDRLTTD
jgi:hypothetical protein